MTPAKRVQAALNVAQKEIFAALADAMMGKPHECRVDFGDYIREHREALGLSLKELADKAGCTKSHIWEIENGRSKNPTVQTVRGLSDGLGIPVMAVFSAALSVTNG